MLPQTFRTLGYEMDFCPKTVEYHEFEKAAT